MHEILSILLNLVALYLVIGIFFSLIFMFKGLHKIDSSAAGTGLLFKLLIFPGCVLFWAFLLYKWFLNKKNDTNTTK